MWVIHKWKNRRLVFECSNSCLQTGCMWLVAGVAWCHFSVCLKICLILRANCYRHRGLLYENLSFLFSPPPTTQLSVPLNCIWHIALLVVLGTSPINIYDVVGQKMLVRRTLRTSSYSWFSLLLKTWVQSPLLILRLKLVANSFRS